MTAPKPGTRVRQNDWVLSPSAFQRLLAWIGPDNEIAADRYRQLHSRLVRFFQWRGDPAPEDAADRAFDRVARRLESGDDLTGAEPHAYLHGVALNIWREHRRAPLHDSLTALGELPSPSADPAHAMEREAELRSHERRVNCLEKCVHKLPPETRRLIVSYHGAGSRKAARKQLAASLDIPLEALRTRIYRVRIALHRCTRACLGREGAK